MLELWSEQEGVEGRTEENLRKWQAFRTNSINHIFESVDLAALNGPLPTWYSKDARTGPLRLDGLLSVLGINTVRVLYISIHVAVHSYQSCRSRRAIKVPLDHDHIRYFACGTLLSCSCLRSWFKLTTEFKQRDEVVYSVFCCGWSST